MTLPAPPRAKGRTLDFEALYRAARDDVFAYVATLLRDPSAAEDVTAQTFERAVRRRGSFDARRGTPRAWLFVVLGARDREGGGLPLRTSEGAGGGAARKAPVTAAAGASASTAGSRAVQ